MSVKINISPKKILKASGLGESRAARRFLAGEVARLSDPYVPMSSGSEAHMKTQVDIAADGSDITYRGPYAHYQYVGLVMVGRKSGSPWARSGEPKRYTNRALKYHGAPMRGKYWDKRMLADRGRELVKGLGAYIRKRNKGGLADDNR